ncbi:hypothetical protein tb265_40720 [Gemmatimonadetes bacterium T265]|nr:hypothetical protein tb265_40720 [Gemmatimonadetes bacterium T265]
MQLTEPRIAPAQRHGSDPAAPQMNSRVRRLYSPSYFEPQMPVPPDAGGPSLRACIPLAVAAVAFVTACRDATGTAEERRAAVVPDSLAFQAVVGGVAWLEGPARDSLNAPPSTAVSFTVADARIASVDAYGLVRARRARRAGRTVVTAVAGGRRVALPLLVRTVRYAAVYPWFGLTTRGEAIAWGGAWSGTESPMSCGHDDQGSLLCSPGDVEDPVFAGTRTRFVALASAEFGTTTCGLTVAGAAVCWTAPDCDYEPHGRCHYTFTTYRGAQPYAALAVGDPAQCAIAADRTAECWGHNYYGQAGTGARGEIARPTPVQGGLRFRQIVVGEYPVFRTCGLTLDGAVWCWRRLGESFVDSTGTPVPTAVAPGLRFTAITPQQCGLTTGGDVRCWAGNDPVPPVTGLGLTRLSDACGLTAAGGVYCWSAGAPVVPQQLPVPFTTLEVGGELQGNDFICGLGTDGRAYCGGRSFGGTYVAAPRPIPGQE